MKNNEKAIVPWGSQLDKIRHTSDVSPYLHFVIACLLFLGDQICGLNGRRFLVTRTGLATGKHRYALYGLHFCMYPRLIISNVSWGRNSEVRRAGADLTIQFDIDERRGGKNASNRSQGGLLSEGVTRKDDIIPKKAFRLHIFKDGFPHNDEGDLGGKQEAIGVV